MKTKGLEEKLPKSGGVYVLWLNGRCVYVGQSSNVRHRVWMHKRQADRVSVVSVGHRVCRLSIEAAAIKALKPRDNIQRPMARAWTAKGLDIWGTFSKWNI